MPKRLLSNHVIFEDKDYGLSVVEISDDCKDMTITPFVRETANTIWVDRQIIIKKIHGIYKIFGTME